MKYINNWRIVIILTMTLGLAPFFPEPHIFGKILWIAGGADGMQPMDWFDFFLHSFPWFFLGRLILNKGYKKIRGSFVK